MSKKDIAAFHRKLARWYGAHGRRSLPWRNTEDAYAIYVSETMLQQTQVKTVLERYYFPFLKRFPTLSALAKAKQQDVLKIWQGLGYYNRAVNLHEAARILCKPPLPTPLPCTGEGSERKALAGEGNFFLPNTVESLMALPGIGRNTAHAIAAFAYKQPVPVVEANVKRVLARIFALKEIPANGLWKQGEQLLDTKNPFDYNQAMMDLGALLCTKRAPKCGECPAEGICKGKTSPELYPVPKQKKAVPVRKKNIVLLKNPEGRYFAEPRQGKFLNGMYRFVEVDNPPPLEGGGRGRGRAEKTTIRFEETTPHPNPPPQGGRGYKYLGQIRQQYSHFTLEAGVYVQKANGSGKAWYSVPQLKQLPFSNAERKVLRLLE